MQYCTTQNRWISQISQKLRLEIFHEMVKKRSGFAANLKESPSQRNWWQTILVKQKSLTLLSLILRQTRVKKKWLNICIYKFIQRLSQFDLDEQREQLGKITWKFSCQNHFQLTTVTKMVAAWKAEEDRCESFFYQTYHF